MREEVQNPNTPGAVKTAILPRVFDPKPSLTKSAADRPLLRSIDPARVNARPGKHSADASHISEAAETGCAYFITHDKRILKKKRELSEVLPPSSADRHSRRIHGHPGRLRSRMDRRERRLGQLNPGPDPFTFAPALFRGVCVCAAISRRSTISRRPRRRMRSTPRPSSSCASCPA